jgi:hypothetical protein
MYKKADMSALCNDNETCTQKPVANMQSLSQFIGQDTESKYTKTSTTTQIYTQVRRIMFSGLCP